MLTLLLFNVSPDAFSNGFYLLLMSLEHFFQLCFELFLGIFVLFADASVVLLDVADGLPHILQFTFFNQEVVCFQMGFDTASDEVNAPAYVVGIAGI